VPDLDIISCNLGSITGALPLLIDSTNCWFISTPIVLKPLYDKQEAVHAPSLPKPTTDICFHICFHILSLF
jgi:hypothetical protein